MIGSKVGLWMVMRGGDADMPNIGEGGGRYMVRRGN
jgi:hypothetical protein